MNDPIQERFDRLEAVSKIQSAELNALLGLLRQMASVMGMKEETFDTAFVSARKQRLHLLLELLESSDPARAARLQALIDEHCRQVPLGYED